MSHSRSPTPEPELDFPALPRGTPSKLRPASGDDDFEILYSIDANWTFRVQNAEAIDTLAVTMTGRRFGTRRSSVNPWTPLCWFDDKADGGKRSAADSKNWVLGMTKEKLCTELNGKGDMVLAMIQGFVTQLNDCGMTGSMRNTQVRCYPRQLKIEIQFRVTEQGVTLEKDSRFVRGWCNVDLRAAKWKFEVNKWSIDARDIAETVKTHKALLDSVEQVVLHKYGTLDIAWTYLKEVNGNWKAMNLRKPKLGETRDPNYKTMGLF